MSTGVLMKVLPSQWTGKCSGMIVIYCRLLLGPAESPSGSGLCTRRSVCTEENEEEVPTFLEGINMDAPGLGLGGSLGFFFGRGSWGGAGKPFGFSVGRPFVGGGRTDFSDFSALAADGVAAGVPFAPCSDSGLVEATRLTWGFITSLGLINSGI